jgi:hypothetical protein
LKRAFALFIRSIKESGRIGTGFDDLPHSHALGLRMTVKSELVVALICERDFAWGYFKRAAILTAACVYGTPPIPLQRARRRQEG